MAGKKGLDHGRRQRALDRLGHRQGLPRRTAPSWPSPSRARRWNGASGRWPARSAPRSSLPCDVTDAASIDATFAEIEKQWGKLDFVVHAIAFSNKDELRGRYLDTSPENFQLTMNVSCYSLTAVAQRAVPLMKDGGSLLTLTYYGAERVIPHYNVMGVAKAALEASVRYLAADLGEQKIRVNAISAGPIKTLAFAGINDGRYILKWNELNSPLKRNITQEEVGNAALYLLSDLGTGMTGEVMHVDGGYHVVGMIKTSSAKQIAELLGNFEGE